MAFVHGDNVIQKISATASDPSRCHSVLPRTFKGSADRMDLHRPDCCRNFCAIFAIAIKDEKPGSGVVWERFSQLLNNPFASRMPSDVEVQNAAAVVVDDEEAVKDAERNGRYREEIHCRDGFSMITQKREPSLYQLRISRSFAHPAGDRSLGSIKAKHKKLTVDARCAPGWILRDHLEDQIPYLLRDSASATRLAPDFGQDAPIELKSSSVPPNNGVRKNDDERLLPIRPNLTGGDPEQFVK